MSESNPTPVVKSAIPVIPAEDLDANVQFYVEKLGFEKAFQNGDYVGIRRDGASIHIYHHTDRNLAENTMYRLSVQHIDALCEEFRANGLDVAVTVQPWGTRDLPVIDPAGNCLTFSEDA